MKMKGESIMFRPKITETLKGYNLKEFQKDLIAGIIVAIIALPLSIALAIASGLSPEKGLYAAIIGSFIIALLGGSRVQIGGPAGAFVVIIYGIVATYGYNGLLTATIMAGILLIIMGLLKFGNIIKYIPSSIINGFSSGIAIVIFSTQIKDFFGLEIDKVPSEFIEKMISYFESFHTFSLQSLLISLLAISIILLWPKINKKIPGTLIAVISTTVLVLLLKWDLPTIGSQFAALQAGFPVFLIPEINIDLVKTLLLPAVTIAILGGIESLLSAAVADGMINDTHDSNTELVAQGTANIVVAFFGGMPVTGALARTSANVQNGGRTPVAGIVKSIVLLLIVLVFMPYVKLIPMAALAGVLTIVAYNMGEWESFKNIRRAPKTDTFLFLTTFLLTVFVDVVVAIIAGIVIAALLFMKKMADVTDIKYVDVKGHKSEIFSRLKYPDEVSIYEIKGAFFFGAASKFIKTISRREINERILIIDMEQVPVMDGTAFETFDNLLEASMKKKIKIILLNVQEQPYSLLEKYGFIPKFGAENFCSDIEAVITRANQVLADKNSNDKQ